MSSMPQARYSDNDAQAEAELQFELLQLRSKLQYHDAMIGKDPKFQNDAEITRLRERERVVAQQCKELKERREQSKSELNPMIADLHMDVVVHCDVCNGRIAPGDERQHSQEFFDFDVCMPCFEQHRVEEDEVPRTIFGRLYLMEKLNLGKPWRFFPQGFVKELQSTWLGCSRAIASKSLVELLETVSGTWADRPAFDYTKRDPYTYLREGPLDDAEVCMRRFSLIKRVTFGQFGRCARILAQHLRCTQAKRGDLVCSILPHMFEAVVVDAASLLARLCAAPLDGRADVAFLQHAFETALPHLGAVVCLASNEARVRQALARAVAAHNDYAASVSDGDSISSDGVNSVSVNSVSGDTVSVDLDGISVIAIDDATVLHCYDSFDAFESDECEWKTLFFSAPPEWIDLALEDKAVMDSDPDAFSKETVSVTFTSGSTGRPKGVKFSRKLAIDNVLKFAGTARPLLVNDVSGSLAHVSERETMYTTLLHGGRSFLATAPSQLLADFRLFRPTELSLTPRVFQVMRQYFNSLGTQHPDLSTEDKLRMTRFFIGSDRLRVFVAGGAYMPPDLREFVQQSLAKRRSPSPPQTLLRIAEAKKNETAGEELEAEEAAFVSAGACIECRAIPFGAVAYGEGYGTSEAGALADDSGRLLDEVQYKLRAVPELGITDEVVQKERRGELLVKTKMLVEGYLGRHGQQANQEKFDEEGYFCTGDVVQFTGLRKIKIVDRVSFLFKLAQGVMVSAQTAENKLCRVPLVRDAFVLSPSLSLAPRAVGAILVVDEALLIDANGDAGTDQDEVSARVISHIRQHAQQAELKHYEIPFFVQLRTEPFSEERGELTVSGKKMRGGLFSLHRPVFDEAYRRLCLGDNTTWQTRFVQLGGDSMAAIAVAAEMTNQGVRIDAGMVLRLGQQGRLDEHETASLDDVPVMIRKDMEAYASAVESARVTVTRTTPTETGTTTVLTGATGFIGRHVLRRCLAAGAPRGRVVCLVRDATEAQQRLHRRFSRLCVEIDWSRVHFVSLDLSVRAEVLPVRVDAAVAAIAEAVGGDDGVARVIHTAAYVNHVTHYADMSATNVGGVALALALARVFRAPLLHLSSLSALPQVQVRADTDLVLSDDTVRRMGGYEQSKWAAECLLDCARQDAGHDESVQTGSVQVLRLGMIGPCRETGDCNETDWFCRGIEELMHRAHALRDDVRADGLLFDLTPVDAVAHFVAAAWHSSLLVNKEVDKNQSDQLRVLQLPCARVSLAAVLEALPEVEKSNDEDTPCHFADRFATALSHRHLTAYCDDSVANVAAAQVGAEPGQALQYSASQLARFAGVLHAVTAPVASQSAETEPNLVYC